MTLPSEDRTDSELFALAASGDAEAFAIIYRRRGRSVYRYALAVAGDAAVAEEIAQETFLAILARPDGFDSQRGELLPYLLGTARRLLLRTWRARAGETDLDPATAEERADDAPDALESLDREQRAEIVRRALAALPEPYREAVALCDINELSYAEAAAILEIPEGTVRSRLHRGRALLARKLGAVERMESRR